jgi:hypothetical protein
MTITVQLIYTFQFKLIAIPVYWYLYMVVPGDQKTRPIIKTSVLAFASWVIRLLQSTTGKKKKKKKKKKREAVAALLFQLAYIRQ